MGQQSSIQKKSWGDTKEKSKKQTTKKNKSIDCKIVKLPKLHILAAALTPFKKIQKCLRFTNCVCQSCRNWDMCANSRIAKCWHTESYSKIRFNSFLADFYGFSASTQH